MHVQRSTLLNSDGQLWHYLSMSASLKVPKNHHAYWSLHFIAWSLRNWISLKEKTSALMKDRAGSWQTCEGSPGRGIILMKPWILSLWNPILSIACFWQTESILRMGQGSFKGIPASRTESHFQRQTGTFFPCQTGMLWQLGMEMVSMTGMDMRQYFSKWQNSSTGHWVLKLAKVSYSIGKCFFFACSIIFFPILSLVFLLLSLVKKFFKTQRIDCHLGVLVRGTDHLC